MTVSSKINVGGKMSGNLYALASMHCAGGAHTPILLANMYTFP